MSIEHCLTNKFNRRTSGAWFLILRRSELGRSQWFCVNKTHAPHNKILHQNLLPNGEFCVRKSPVVNLVNICRYNNFKIVRMI
jgi:hypothetical protein